MTADTQEKMLDSAAAAFVISHKNQPLHDSVLQALENHFAQLNETQPDNLYEQVLSEIEAPLLESVMEYTKNNQSRADIILGLSRGTLRKKLKIYGMLD